ncbi:uncharacterized protein LOC143100240 [Alosa pseudoharengus]|uniref:uncharacterized protein LOC143100240 n=1 Tax=Alosa pseudoharengus TaxID=34774 RepID=UPI003F8BCF05
MAKLRSSGLSTVVSLCLALLLQTRAEDCITSIRVVRHSLSHPANLSCANMEGEERSVLLHKEGHLIHNHTVKGQNDTVAVKEGMYLHIVGHKVWYEISQVTDSDAGVYTCEVKKMYPPPYKAEKRISALITEGHCPDEGQNQAPRHLHHGRHGHLNSSHTGCPRTQQDSAPLTQALWPVCCVMLSLLCVVLLVIVLVFGHKLRSNAQSESEYVNTRPADCKRQKGVLRPKWEGLLF